MVCNHIFLGYPRCALCDAVDPRLSEQGASLIIQGQPLATFTFDVLPSWNDAIAMANKRPLKVRSWAHARAPFNSFIQKWRDLGKQMAHEFMEGVWAEDIWRPYLIRRRAMVIVKVFRATDRTYDVHNPYCKAVFDGFSDAGIWKDDNWKWLPWVLYGYMEMDELDDLFIGQAFVIEVYELGQVILNGVEQTLRDWSHEL